MLLLYNKTNKIIELLNRGAYETNLSLWTAESQSRNDRSSAIGTRKGIDRYASLRHLAVVLTGCLLVLLSYRFL